MNYTSDDVDRIIETHKTVADRDMWITAGIALLVGIALGGIGASFLWGMG